MKVFEIGGEGFRLYVVANQIAEAINLANDHIAKLEGDYETTSVVELKTSQIICGEGMPGI